MRRGSYPFGACPATRLCGVVVAALISLLGAGCGGDGSEVGGDDAEPPVYARVIHDPHDGTYQACLRDSIAARGRVEDALKECAPQFGKFDAGGLAFPEYIQAALGPMGSTQSVGTRTTCSAAGWNPFGEDAGDGGTASPPDPVQV
jgi:hypothetical protein